MSLSLSLLLSFCWSVHVYVFVFVFLCLCIPAHFDTPDLTHFDPQKRHISTPQKGTCINKFPPSHKILVFLRRIFTYEVVNVITLVDASVDGLLLHHVNSIKKFPNPVGLNFRAKLVSVGERGSLRWSCSLPEKREGGC